MFEKVLVGGNPTNSLEYQFRGWHWPSCKSPYQRRIIALQHKYPGAGQTTFHLRERRRSLTITLLGFSIWSRVMNLVGTNSS